jgi:hypothetical protein
VRPRWLALVALAGVVGCDDFGALGTCPGSGRCLVTCSQDFFIQDAGQVTSAVWVGASGDVWVGTQSNAIFHRLPGGGWVRELSPGSVSDPYTGETAFWGVGDTPSFAGGFNDAFEIYSSGNWQSSMPTPNASIFAFYQTPDSNLWVAGQNSAYRVVPNWNTTADWGDLNAPADTQWQGVWGVGPDVWMVGLHADAGPLPAPWVWHVSDAGAPQPIAEPSGQLESVWGDPSGFFAVGQDGQYTAMFCRLDAGTWSCASDSTFGASAHGLWGRSATDVWATSDGYVLHFDGSRWSALGQFNSPDGGGASLYRISGNAQEVWAAGDNALVHCP